MISALITWWATNPLYAFVSVVGVVIGIVYGLDGWKGDTKDADLKDSPRVRNLIWVLGAGFVALIGDLKVLDPNASKLWALLAYFGPFAVTFLLVVGFWGLLIAIERLWSTYKGTTYGYRFIDAVGDYVFYGYGHSRRRS